LERGSFLPVFQSIRKDRRNAIGPNADHRPSDTKPKRLRRKPKRQQAAALQIGGSRSLTPRGEASAGDSGDFDCELPFIG
jgi:hypothetical protein